MTRVKGLVGEADLQAKVRASVSLSPELHAELEQIARDKRVSMAWVIREAAEIYVAQQRHTSPSRA
jgi:predicted transcriptional regulator